jgi:hypothetical protein
MMSPKAGDLISVIAILGCHVAHAATFCFTPSESRDLFFFSGITLTLYMIWQNSRAQSELVIPIISTLVPIVACRCLNSLILHHPEQDFRRNSDGPDFNILNEGKLAKFKWGVSHVLSWRAVGWRHAAKGMLPAQGVEFQSRASFVGVRVVRLFTHYLILDIISLYIQTQAHFSEVRQNEYPLPSHRLIYGLVNAIAAYSTLQMQYTAGSILAVTTGLWEPKVGESQIVFQVPLTHGVYAGLAAVVRALFGRIQRSETLGQNLASATSTCSYITRKAPLQGSY